MDLRVLLTTFGIIFLAEMGDKTQLAAMTMAADSEKPWAVFFGCQSRACGSVGVGGFGGRCDWKLRAVEWVKRVAAIAFIVIGVLMLLGKFLDRITGFYKINKIDAPDSPHRTSLHVE